MGRWFLFASAGFLLGSLLLTSPSERLSSALLLACAVAVALAALGWRMRAVQLFVFLLAASGGYAIATQAALKWETLPMSGGGATEWVVIKRELPKAWYQPIVLAPAESAGPAARVLWRAPKTVELRPGERIRLGCDLKQPENFDPHFDYRRYLATRGIGWVCERAAQHELLSGQVGWRSMLSAAQQRLRTQITTALPEPAAGLLQGLFLGGDDALSPAVSESFRRAGLSHIVAVSGYNMTLVAFAVLFLALLAGLWRKTATVFAMLGILAFLLLIDTSAASLRAALMAWIVFLAYFLGRPASAPHGLMLAATFMALENPLIVRYDVGFQLSLLATLALIITSPWIDQLMRSRGLGSRWLALPLATLAIELFIFPVIAFHFGTVSLVGPLANTLALPLIPIAMALGFVALLAAIAVPPLATFFALPAWLILTLIVRVAEVIGSFDWAVIEGLTPSPSFLWLWYIVLAALVWYSRKFQYAYVLRMDQPHHSH